MPALASQTLSSDSLPALAPTPTLSPNPQGSLRSPRRAAAHHQLRLSLGRRAAAPGEGGPARPYLRPQRGARAPGASPGSRRPPTPSPSLHPWYYPKYPAPLAQSEQLVEELVRQAPRVPATALTQSGQQEGLAPFLRLGPLFVAGPEQGLEPGPGQRALHLPHGQRRPGAQRARATREH